MGVGPASYASFHRLRQCLGGGAMTLFLPHLTMSRACPPFCPCCPKFNPITSFAAGYARDPIHKRTAKSTCGD